MSSSKSPRGNNSSSKKNKDSKDNPTSPRDKVSSSRSRPSLKRDNPKEDGEKSKTRRNRPSISKTSKRTMTMPSVEKVEELLKQIMVCKFQDFSIEYIFNIYIERAA